MKDMKSSTASSPVLRGSKPLLGIRRQPGRLALAVFRLPLTLYAQGRGGLMGRSFVLVEHAGRKTGKLYRTVAMVLRYDPGTEEAVICSAWGQNTDWIRNIRARPALRVQLGQRSFAPEQRFLTADESRTVVAQFRRQHPVRSRVITAILGWGDLRSDQAVLQFVSTHPFVAFRPPRPARV
jgi:deazaflavin-dependent oxidoreductase (nitroreductase family)